jgi:hypothetical protein
MKRLKKENKIALLNFKINSETLDVTKEQNNLGFNNLNEILLNFRKNLDKNNPNQQKKFDYIFFNTEEPVRQLNKNSIIKKDSKKIEEITATNDSDDLDLISLKKILKKVVKITHPDKTLNLPSFLKENFTLLYQQAIDAFKNKNYSKLIYVASELSIEINDSLIDRFIKPEIKKIEKSILSLKNKIGYVWYHLEDKQKEPVLKDHLIKLGFKFTDKSIKDAIKRKKIKRKTGIRPSRLLKTRLKK